MAQQCSQTDQAVLIQALRQLNADSSDHINGQLIFHLEGTYRYLENWGNREALCVAGLYHAIYSTDGYPLQLTELSQRDDIIELIGVEAENIVYYYAACDRSYFYPKIGDESFLYRNRFNDQKLRLDYELFSDVLELTLANEIEIASINQKIKEENKDRFVNLFERFKPYISARGFQCYQTVFDQTN